ncbi:MAG: hypothetical protein JWN40_444 [Phycisphaerales bacterium]|nr:hypothetical protein [Phycisphaerales bacterium]
MSHAVNRSAAIAMKTGPLGRGRKKYWALGTVALLFLLVYFVAPKIIAPFLRERLQQMVSKHLNAELKMERLSYHFPYGLTAHNAALVAWDAHGQQIDLLRVKELDLHLAQLPWGDGPLVIKRIIIKQPSVHFILTENGLLGTRNLVKPVSAEDQIAAAAAGKQKKEKPSDYFRLRRFEIHDGQILFEDHRERSNRPPLIWKNLTVEMDTEPTSGALYSYDLSARNAPLAVANARGKLDVDSGRLDVERFVFGVKVDKDKRQEQLPPSWQEILQRYEVAGSMSLSGSATVPLKDPGASQYKAVLELPSGSARLSDGAGRIDRLALKLRLASEDKQVAATEVSRPVVMSDTSVAATQGTTRAVAAQKSTRSKQPPTTVNLDLLEIGTRDTLLHIEKGEATIDPESDQWRVKNLLCQLELGKDRSGLPTRIEQALAKMDLSGKMRLTATAAGPIRPAPGTRFMDQVEYQVVAYPRELVARPMNWPASFTGVSGTVRANRDVITVENAEGEYHGDKFFVTGARIPLEHIDREFRLEEISGSVQLTGTVEDYGRPFEFVARELRPSGTWYALGFFARRNGMPPGTKPDFHFDIRSDDGGATIGKKRIPLTNVKAEIVSTPRLVDIKRLEVNSLGGTGTAEGQLTPGRGKEVAYQGQVWLRDVDLKSLGELVSVQQGKKPTRLSGKGNANARVEGTGPDENHTGADNFQATGRFEVLNGDFWSLPTLEEIAKGANVAGNALTVGQAAGHFHVHDQKVELTDAALSAPVLGVQGSGSVMFDGRLNLRVVAAPLADWKDQMKRTRIPIVSDVAGEVLGGLQKMVNTATKTLLYEFRVTGSTREPKIDTVPSPVLTEGVAKLFGKMMRGERLGDDADDGGAKGRRR